MCPGAHMWRSDSSPVEPVLSSLYVSGGPWTCRQFRVASEPSHCPTPCFDGHCCQHSSGLKYSNFKVWLPKICSQEAFLTSVFYITWSSIICLHWNMDSILFPINYIYLLKKICSFLFHLPYPHITCISLFYSSQPPSWNIQAVSFISDIHSHSILNALASFPVINLEMDRYTCMCLLEYLCYFISMHGSLGLCWPKTFQ